jgi:hypothetical protein
MREAPATPKEPIAKLHFRYNLRLRAATYQPLVNVPIGCASSRLTGFAPTSGAFANESEFCNGFNESAGVVLPLRLYV